MALQQYIWVYNPIAMQLQLTLNPAYVPALMNTSPDVPARPGNIAVFGEGNKIEDSGFYLNEAGQVVKVTGGYFA